MNELAASDDIIMPFRKAEHSITVVSSSTRFSCCREALTAEPCIKSPDKVLEAHPHPCKFVNQGASCIFCHSWQTREKPRISLSPFAKFLMAVCVIVPDNLCNVLEKWE
jgi:hypothetical protein